MFFSRLATLADWAVRIGEIITVGFGRRRRPMHTLVFSRVMGENSPLILLCHFKFLAPQPVGTSLFMVDLDEFKPL